MRRTKTEIRELIRLLRTNKQAEIEYVERFQKGERWIADLLLKTHKPFLKIMLRRWSFIKYEYEDYYQIACMSLIEAARRFDVSKGARLITYAEHYVQGHIRRHYIQCGAVVRIPVHRHVKMNYKRKVLTFTEMNEHHRTDETNVSFDETLIDQTPLALELLADAELYQLGLRVLLEHLMRDLEPRRRGMMFRYYGESEVTFREIGKTYSLTHQAVQQNVATGLQLCREAATCLRRSSTFEEWVVGELAGLLTKSDKPTELS